MPHRLPEDIVPRGKAIYEGLRTQLEQTDWGKFAVIDVYSGDYEVDVRDADATGRLLSRRPDAITYGVRIGDTVAFRFRSVR
jgi:hypothetical protein